MLFLLSGDRSTLYGRKHPRAADPPSSGKLTFGDGEEKEAESMRFVLIYSVDSFCGEAVLARRRCFGLGRPLMCREGADVVLVGSGGYFALGRMFWFREGAHVRGGCFCLGRVEWLRVWRKVLVGSGESTLRRQIDPPVPKTTSGAIGRAAQEWPRQAYRSPLIMRQIDVLEMRQISVFTGRQQH